MKDLFLKSKSFRLVALSIGVFSVLFLVSLAKPHKVEAAAAQIAGFVMDQNGNFLNNARVTLRVGRVNPPQWCGYSMQNGTYTYTTGANGAYKFGRDDFSDGVCCNASSIQIQATYFLDGSGWINIGAVANGATNWQNITINISPPAQPPGTYITANRTHGSITVTTGTVVTIGWISSNATSCFVSPPNWTGTGGSQTITATTTTTYTEACVGPGGSGSDSVTVFVINPQPINTLNVNSSPITGIWISGDYAGTTNYTSSGTATISGTITAPSTSGSYTFSSWSGCTSSSGRNCNVSVSGGATQTVTANYVFAPSPDFTISISPGSQTVTAGNSTVYTVTVTSLNGFSGSVNLSNNFIGTGISTSYSINPISGGSGSSILTVPTSTTTPATTYTVTVTGTSGALTHTTAAALVVNAPPPLDFTIDLSLNDSSVMQGNSTTGVVTITPKNGFTGDVDLTLPAVGNGISFTWTGSSTVTIVDSSAKSATFTLQTSNPGTPVRPAPGYTITATGQSETLDLTHSATASLEVTAHVLEPWIQTTRGDVGSVGPINLTTPCVVVGFCPANMRFADKLVISKALITPEFTSSTFRTAKRWLVPGYLGAGLLPANDPKNYVGGGLGFKDKFTSSTTTPLPAGPGLPGDKGVWKTSGSFSWNGKLNFVSGGCSDLTQKGATVIFVDGSLTINGNPTLPPAANTCPLVIFVGGNTVVSALDLISGLPLSTINAVIFTQGTFTTQPKVPAPDTVTLNINGAVLSIGGFYDTLLSKSTLQRNLGSDLFIGNPAQPAERFNYQPKYLWYLSDYIGIAKNRFSEVKP